MAATLAESASGAGPVRTRTASRMWSWPARAMFLRWKRCRGGPVTQAFSGHKNPGRERCGPDDLAAQLRASSRP